MTSNHVSVALDVNLPIEHLELFLYATNTLGHVGRSDGTIGGTYTRNPEKLRVLSLLLATYGTSHGVGSVYHRHHHHFSRDGRLVFYRLV